MPPPEAEKDAAEALRLARESRLELQTQSARLRELEGQVRDLAEMLSWSAARMRIHERTLDSLRENAGLAARPGSTDSSAPPAHIPARVSPDEATEYRKALDLFFARDYATAITAFSALLRDHPDGAYAANAQYWIGESLYGTGDYEEALTAFERVFSLPGDNKHDDARLKIGYCRLQLEDPARAREEFRKLVSSYPNSEYVERARGELEKLKNR